MILINQLFFKNEKVLIKLLALAFLNSLYSVQERSFSGKLFPKTSLFQVLAFASEGFKVIREIHVLKIAGLLHAFMKSWWVVQAPSSLKARFGPHNITVTF